MVIVVDTTTESSNGREGYIGNIYGINTEELIKNLAIGFVSVKITLNRLKMKRSYMAKNMGSKLFTMEYQLDQITTIRIIA